LPEPSCNVVIGTRNILTTALPATPRAAAVVEARWAKFCGCTALAVEMTSASRENTGAIGSRDNTAYFLVQSLKELLATNMERLWIALGIRIAGEAPPEAKAKDLIGTGNPFQSLCQSCQPPAMSLACSPQPTRLSARFHERVEPLW